MRTRTSLAALAVLAGAFASGCASDRGYEKSEDLAERIDDTVAAMDHHAAARAKVFTSLASLATEPVESLPVKFEEFSTAVDRVATCDATLRDNVASMKTAAHRRFLSWGEENLAYQDDAMRDRAQDRRTEASDDFRDTVKDADAMLLESAELLAYLTDLRRSLGNDLTAKGLEEVESFSGKARDSNEDLDETSVPVRASLVATSIAITSGALSR